MQAKGSTKAASRRLNSSGSLYTTSAGNLTYSAKAPFKVTPGISMLSQRLGFPLKQKLHLPQGITPFPVTLSPTLKSSTFEPAFSIVPENSCPIVKPTT